MDIVNTSSLATKSDLSALFIAFDMRLQEIFNMLTDESDKFVTTIPTNTRVEKLPWLQLFPQMREWTGDRVFNNYVLQDLQVDNKKWELTAQIDRTQIEDDQFGAFLSLAPARIAREVKLLKIKEISKKIEENPDTFDGVSYFDGYHPVDPSGFVTGTQSNELRGLTDSNGTDAVGALTPENLQAARALHRTRKGPDGLPLGLMPNALMVHPNAELDARNAATGGLIFKNGSNGAAAVSNVYQSAYEVIVNPYLTDANAWYLLSTNESVMPFLWSERTPPEYTTIVDPQNPLVFLKDQYTIGCRRRGAAFDELGLYYLATKCTSDS